VRCLGSNISQNIKKRGRKMKKAFLITVAILLVGGLMFNAYAESTEKPQYGGIFTNISYPRSPKANKMGEPAEVWGVDAGFSTIMLEGLVRSVMEKDGSVGFRPVLATSWKLLQDGKSWEFKLRRGVKFHDKTDFNAAAVKYCHDILKDKHGTAMTTVESIDVVDDYTVRYNLSKYDSMFLTNLQEAFSQIISPTARETKGKKWSSANPVGTGAFKFVKYEKAVVLVTKKFDDYWEKGLPYLDGVTCHFVKEALVGQAALEKGSDLCIFRANAKETDILKKKGFNYVMAPGVLRIMTFDSKNPESAFAKKKVRQAVGYAIDRETYAEILSFGYDEPTYQVAPKDSYAYNPSVKPRKYNPVEAKRLLAEAGYPNGFKCQIFGGGQNRDLWTAVQGSLAKVGIQAQVKIVPPPKARQLRYQGGLPTNSILSLHVGYRADYIQGIDEQFKSTAARLPELYRSPGLDDHLTAAIQAKDFTGKKENTQKAVKLIQEDALVVPIWMHMVFWPYNKSVKNIKFNWPDHSRFTFRDTWISQ
jgi:ABC-type transport system substrate-binding protein